MEALTPSEPPTLLSLCDDSLEIILSHLGDILIPRDAAYFYECCRRLWSLDTRPEVLRAAKQHYRAACSLAVRCVDWEARFTRGMVYQIKWTSLGLCVADCHTLSQMSTSVHLRSTLHTLSLRDNGIGDSNLKALLPGLQQLSVLSSLSLEDNNISAAGLAAFGDAMEGGGLHALAELYLGGNAFEDESDSEISGAVSTINGAVQARRYLEQWSPPFLFAALYSEQVGTELFDTRWRRTRHGLNGRAVSKGASARRIYREDGGCDVWMRGGEGDWSVLVW